MKVLWTICVVYCRTINLGAIHLLRTHQYGVGISSAIRTLMYCCHSDIIICAYRVSGWVWNPGICAYVLNECPLISPLIAKRWVTAACEPKLIATVAVTTRRAWQKIVTYDVKLNLPNVHWNLKQFCGRMDLYSHRNKNAWNWWYCFCTLMTWE